MVEFEDIDSDKRIILSPNRSATWAHTKYLMLVMVFFVMVVFVFSVSASVSEGACTLSTHQTCITFFGPGSRFQTPF